MQPRRDWFLQDDHQESGPMTEVELRQRLVQSTGAKLASWKVRQGSSGWHSALAVLQRFRDLAENGVYLRCKGASEIEGPFTIARAVERLEAQAAESEKWKARIGRNELWQTAEEFLQWHVKRQGSAQKRSAGLGSNPRGSAGSESQEANFNSESSDDDIIYDGVLLSGGEDIESSEAKNAVIEPAQTRAGDSDDIESQDIVLPATLLHNVDEEQSAAWSEPLDAAENLVNAAPVHHAPSINVTPAYASPNLQYKSSKKSRASGTGSRLVWVLVAIGLLTVLLVAAGLGSYYFLRNFSESLADDSNRVTLEDQSGGADAGSPNTNAGSRAESAPATAPIVPPGALFRPVFLTRSGRVDAGTAFAARLPGSDYPILISALHLMGPAGGLSQQISADQLTQQWNGLELVDCVSSESVGRIEGTPLALPRAQPFPELSPTGDVIAYKPDGYGTFRPYRIAIAPPRQGESVWLVSEVIGSDALTHRARVLPMEEGWLTYRFDDPQIELRATSGAPIVNSKGEVVGVNAGGGELDGQVIGVGTPAFRFQAPLRAAMDR